VIDKVIAYVTRGGDHGAELLVFEHVGLPEAGVQVPAGTVEPDEAIETALHRELAEESGLTGLTVIAALGSFPDRVWNVRRHVYHLAAPPDAPDSWEHTVHGDGEDAGFRFRYSWRLVTGIDELAGAQHQWLDRLADPR
jgi:ADP-ribose pyrophosphatase YjhB (NUDIX family)